MSDGWPGTHRMPCGVTFPLAEPMDVLILQMHQSRCVVCQAQLIVGLAELEEGT